MAGFTAGTISYHGLIRFFGTSSEKTTGVMNVTDSTDWQTRTANAATKPWSTTVPPGPTYTAGADGSTVGTEWWHVWNYLNYNVGGVVVGSTGTNNSTWNVSYTPLHESGERINAFFDGGSVQSSDAVSNIAQYRKDCFAVIGAAKSLTLPVPENYGSALTTDFGISNGYTGNTGSNVIYVANRKQFLKDWNNSGSSSLDSGTMSLSSDVAGCIGRAVTSNNAWAAPAGIKRGAINGVVGLEQTYTPTDVARLNDNGVSPVISFPGRGSFLMGNSTGFAMLSGSRGSIHVVALLNYVKTVIKDIAYDYVFEPNNEANRTQFITRTKTLMDSVQASGSISAYNIVCNAANNQGITFTANITLTPVNLAESITLTVTNNGTTPPEVFEI
jgi:hypothetical protein